LGTFGRGDEAVQTVQELGMGLMNRMVEVPRLVGFATPVVKVRAEVLLLGREGGSRDGSCYMRQSNCAKRLLAIG
jgi:hypothetical protein